MDTLVKILSAFLRQSSTGDLKTSAYPKEWLTLKMKTSFGMGAPARVPWIGFVGDGMAVSRGINPVYLYYKSLNILILAYGISETSESPEAWPIEVMNSAQTIEAYLDEAVPRYGNSFVFKAYKVSIEKDVISIMNEKGESLSAIDLESDLNTLVEYYKKILSVPGSSPIEERHNQGLFYMEKQLEDFLIQNWEHTELGERFELIIEEGELLSQQYRTDVGPIDILAKDKQTGAHVVIELKKNQTSDDTVGQVARYMGWVREHLKDLNVQGVIIAGQYDKKLDYALKMFPNTEVYLYEVSFKLNDFKS